MKLSASSEYSMKQLFAKLTAEYGKRGWLQITIHDDVRSRNQNSLSHAWYEQISRELGEDSPEGVKAFCKLHYGVPILRAENDHFREAYDETIRPMEYEKKVKIMGEPMNLPVTSLMSKKQLNRYLELLQTEFTARGVKLEFPGDGW